mgnify:CR=1 FL=1
MGEGIIRIGVVGAGGIAAVHIEQFQRLPEQCAVVAITDVIGELAKSRAEQYRIPHVYDSIEELIASPEVDAVVICVPNRYHAPYAVQALRAGKHVLLEKPMGVSLEAAREILRASRASSGILMIAHQMRFEAVAMQIRERAQRGELGRIYTAKAGWMRRKGIPGWGSWFTQKEVSGGGPLIDIGVHMLDLSLYLMGNPKPVAVSGATYAEFGPKRKGIGAWGTPNWDGVYDVEDLATAMIRMEDGSTLTLDVSWAAHMETDSAPYIHLMGSEGGVSLRGNAGKLLTEKDDQLIDIPLEIPADDEGARLRMSRHFLECIRDGREPLIPVMSGYTTNLILDAIYRSSQLGREIELDWDLD